MADEKPKDHGSYQVIDREMGQMARPTLGAHSPSLVLRCSWTARAARACSAALRPARRSRRAGWTPGTAAHRSVLQAGFLEGGHSRTRARPQCSHLGLRLFSFLSLLNLNSKRAILAG